MTSEILIMKNDTIVMAADSAVTIGNRKTHTGAINYLDFQMNHQWQWWYLEQPHSDQYH